MPNEVRAKSLELRGHHLKVFLSERNLGGFADGDIGLRRNSANPSPHPLKTPSEPGLARVSELQSASGLPRERGWALINHVTHMRKNWWHHAERPAHKHQPKRSGNETVLNAKLWICEGCSGG